MPTHLRFWVCVHEVKVRFFPINFPECLLTALDYISDTRLRLFQERGHASGDSLANPRAFHFVLCASLGGSKLPQNFFATHNR